MQSRKHTVIPGLIMLVISALFLSQSLTMEKAEILDPTGGSFFPALITLIMLIASIVVIFTRPKSEETEEEEVFKWKDYSAILLYFLLILIYVILLPILTFFPATFLFLVVSMIYLRNVSWKLNFSVSIGTILVIYLLFSQLFKIIFP